MTNKNKTIKELLDDLDKLTQDIESSEVDLEDAVNKYKTAIKLASEIKTKLEVLENEVIEIQLDKKED